MKLYFPKKLQATSYKLQAGFTLIELLVVIAIIGILSGIVLASLGTARDKATDAAIKSNLANARAQAELFYSDTGNIYTGVCAVGAGTINTLVDAARVAGGFNQALNITFGTVGAWNVATCHAVTQAWVAEAPLKGSVTATPKMYCVDSTGISKEKSTVLAANDVAC